MSSRLITLVAPCLILVAIQSVPVSPPPMTMTCRHQHDTLMTHTLQSLEDLQRAAHLQRTLASTLVATSPKHVHNVHRVHCKSAAPSAQHTYVSIKHPSSYCSTSPTTHLLPCSTDVLTILQLTVQQTLGVAAQEVHGKVNTRQVSALYWQVTGTSGASSQQHHITV